jgi:phage terminase large subunit GpA-like protein
VELGSNGLQSGSDVYEPSFAAGWLPEPKMSVSAWADRYRVIGSKSGFAGTRWQTSTTPYLREIMDALGPREPAREIVVVAGTQIGKTECGNNWIAFLIDRSPSSILVVRPTVEDARRFSRQRLDPMFMETPELARLVKPTRAREGGNTLLMKEFPGGVLFLVGSNSATGMKSMPIRNLFCDEVDEFPGDVDAQGDPITLARKRMVGPTYANRKVLLTGTPTIKDVSRIEREFLETDQRRYFVPCPFCDAYDYIRWENIKYETEDHKLIPESVALACTSCGTLIEERYKLEFLPRGVWRPTAEATSPEKIGFHISSLYSPFGWFPWTAAVEEWLKAQDDPLKLKAFVNTVLAQTWEERGDSVEPDSLLARVEDYAAPVPNGVAVLVAAVDVQDDRLEVKVKGYGAAEESWLIDYAVFHGDPGSDVLWFDLDKFLLGKYRHESGRDVPISCVAVDSGGHYTDEVYKFCATRLKRRVFAIRGGNDKGKPLVAKPSTRNRYHVKLFTLCVDTGKGSVERAIRKWVKNRGSVRVWVKTRERNEALDLEVYCLAALYILGPGFVRTLPERAKALSVPPDQPGKRKTRKRTRPAIPRRRGYIDSYKG